MNRAKLACTVVILLCLLGNAFAQDVKQTINSTNWQLMVYDYQIVDKEIPVVCGLTTISTGKGQKGVTINARLQPTKSNTEFVIDLMKDYKMKVGDRELQPADMCVSTKNKRITLSQTAGRITDLTKSDFPLNLTISFLIEASDKISFFIEDSKEFLIK